MQGNGVESGFAEMRKDLKAINANIEDLVDNLRKFREDGIQKIEKDWEHGVKRVQKTAGDVVEGTEKRAGEAAGYLKEHPVMALVGALGAGWVLSKLLK